MKNKRNEIFSEIGKEQNNELNNLNFNPELVNMSKKRFKWVYLLFSISAIISGLIIMKLYWFLVSAERQNNINKMFFIPILICGLAVSLGGIVALYNALIKVKTPKLLQNSDEYEIKKNTYHDLSKLFFKLYVVGFLLVWFGFLTFFCWQGIKQKSYSVLLWTGPFWLAGIAAGYVNLRKK